MASSFPHLKAFLAEVWTAAESEDAAGRMAAFAQLLKEKRYWPALQWKKFHDGSGLVLLHNTYKRTDVEAFQDLYDECRSVVLDFEAPLGENVVVSLSNAIPVRMALEDYKTVMRPDDIAQVSYEGTTISVYYHRDQWHFSTASCPSVAASRYAHPTKRHGTMLDETLLAMFPGETEETVRGRLTAVLNPDHAYYFILVHHENTHIMNYGEGYKKLVHIQTRDKATMEPVALPFAPFLEAPFADGIFYSPTFDRPEAAVEWLSQPSDPKNPNTFGYIVKTGGEDGKLLKVCRMEMLDREQEDMGHPNPWMNMLWVYIQNRPNYHVNHYIEKYCPDITFPTDQFGRTLAPVYLIHTAICTLRDCLYQSYRYTTKYYPEYNRWKMNKTLDESLPKILRFHLSQLRIIQVGTHQGEYLTPHTVYHYICHHQSMANLLKLIGFFANTAEDSIHLTPRTAECFRVLYRMLSSREVA
jgi:hypothetical protein